MADAIKVLSTETTCNTTPNTFSSGTLIRVVNTNTSDHVLITKRDAANNILGTFTLGHDATSYSIEHVMKQPTDTLEANNNTGVYACSIGYY